MGKKTGFLEYSRKENSTISPSKRIKNFREFHKFLPEDERREQAARCMNCGIPFCQSGMLLNGKITGCPLNNLIPEWNDSVYENNPKNALIRLLKTDNFPEFTGRVCPAPCEAACVNNLVSKSVTIKDNELYIIENAFKNKLITPSPPKTRTDKKVAVIGSGPAGLAAADTLNKQGHNITVFEKNDRLGGLLMYGIPSMKLEKDIVDRRISLMRDEGICFKTNTDIGKDIPAKDILNEFDAVILACGAENPRDINVSGRESKGIYFAVDFLTLNTKSMLDSEFKDKIFYNSKNKKVIVLGGGDTGCDCVAVCLRQGCRDIKQLEISQKNTSSYHWPEYPDNTKIGYGQEEAISLFGKDPRIFGTTIKEIIADENKNIKAVKTVMAEIKDGKLVYIPHTEKILDADILIIATGFSGTKKYIADGFGVELNDKNTIKTKHGKYQTNNSKIFSAGDMRTGQSLVVCAMSEGRKCAFEVDKFLMD